MAGSGSLAREHAPLGDDFSHSFTLVAGHEDGGASPGLSGFSTVALAGDALFIAGAFERDLRVGDQAIIAAGTAAGVRNRGFLTRTTASAEPVWLSALPDTGSSERRFAAQVSALVANADGGAIAAFTATGSLPLPARFGDADNSTGSAVEVSGAPGAVITAIARDGTPTWHVPVHGSRYLRVTDLALAPDRALLGTGVFTGTMRIAETIVTSAGFGDIFSFRIDAQGRLQWLQRAGGRGPDAGLAIAARGEAIALAGTFSDDAYLGRAALAAHGRPTRRRRPRQDGFLARLDPNGAPAWARALGGNGADSAFSTAIGTDGAIFVAGEFATSLAEGEHELRGEDDGFIAAFEPDGALRFTVAIAGPGRARAVTLGALSDGAAVAGSFTDTTSVGPHRLESAGAHDIFAAKIAGTGRVTWARRFGGPGDDSVAAIATAEEAAETGMLGGSEPVVMVGSFADSADLGDSDPVSASGERSGFAVGFSL